MGAPESRQRASAVEDSKLEAGKLETAFLVGAPGFEPGTPCAQGRCATRLRYAPTLLPIIAEASAALPCCASGQSQI